MLKIYFNFFAAGNTSVCWVGTNEDLVASGSDNAAIYLWYELSVVVRNVF